MRYYQYISDAKLEMLFEQIPAGFLDGAKVELGFDFGVLKGKLSGEQPNSASRIARLGVVEKYLDQNAMIKSTLEENNWVKGDFSAKVGYLSHCPGLVLFTGEYDGAKLILAGSENHLVAGAVNQIKDMGWSFMPRLLTALMDYISLGYDLVDIETDGKLKPNEIAESRIFGGGGSTGSMVEALYRLHDDAPYSPVINYSFLARVFWIQKNHTGEVLALGSPLYISQ